MQVKIYLIFVWYDNMEGRVYINIPVVSVQGCRFDGCVVTSLPIVTTSQSAYIVEGTERTNISWQSRTLGTKNPLQSVCIVTSNGYKINKSTSRSRPNLRREAADVNNNFNFLIDNGSRLLKAEGENEHLALKKEQIIWIMIC